MASNLNNPTPGNIRDESLLLKENKPDEFNVLRHFTDAKNPSRLDIDKFRPVVKYLAGTVPNPNIRVVELVAWLINTDEIITNPTKKNNFIYLIGIVAVIGIFITVIYMEGSSKSGCMYWTGSEYKEINCDTKMAGVQIFALDQQKLAYFKKITQPDTITLNSVDKVWYSKINNEVEFFTTKGKHPLEHNRILKPVTAYILGRYGNTRIVSLINTNTPAKMRKD